METSQNFFENNINIDSNEPLLMTENNRLTVYQQSISGLKLFNDKRIRQGFETKYMEI